MPKAISSALGFIGIVSCYLTGEWLVQITRVPLPGALIGMLLLLVILLFRQRSPGAVAQVAQPLLGHMTLLFVPAVVGVMAFWPEVKQNLTGIVLALVITTVLSMGITARIAQQILKRKVQDSR